MAIEVTNNTVPYVLRPAFAKKLKSPTKDDINKLYTEISSKDESKPTFWERRSLMDYLATSVLGVGIISGIVGHLRESKAVIGGAIAVAIAGIAGFIYKFVKTPALEKLTNIADTTETKNTDVEPEVDLTGEMSPEYEQWLIDVKKKIYNQPDCSERIQELSERNDLSDEERAELAGLKEFPDNTKMAQLVKMKELGKEPLTLLKETELESVRLMYRVKSGNLLSDDQEVVDKYKRMLYANKETFLKDLDSLLKERPVNVLLSDELFKDMIYQRYQVVTTVGSKGRESNGLRGGKITDDDWMKLYRETNAKTQFCGEVISKDEALDVFSRIEETRQRLIDGGEIAIPEYDHSTAERSRRYVEGYPGHFEKPIFEGEQVYSNTICQCTHGGGFRYLQLILSGKHPGSKLEHQEGRGIQVHPYAKGPYLSRPETVYAPRSEYHFDTGAVLYFRVEAQYLDAEPNWYEAGIRSEFLEHATDFRLENLVTGKVLQGDTLKDIREAIAKSKIGIGDL